jgi:hypothetical protein
LNGRADQRHLLHRPDILKGEFQAQGKKKQGNADLGRQFDFVDARNGKTADVRTQDNPCQDVSQDQWLTQSLHQEAAKKCGNNKDNDVSCNTHTASLLKNAAQQQLFFLPGTGSTGKHHQPVYQHARQPGDIFG